jgi:type VI secretion system secreted protein VgrG
MSSPTQKERLIYCNTALGEDVLLLTSFVGREEMSRLFSYQLDFISENKNITPQDVINKPIMFAVRHVDDAPRVFHGIVSRFTGLSSSMRGLRTYRAEVVPWLWFLTRTTNCRIFQKMSVPDIVKKVFTDLGFTDFETKLTGKYLKHDYTVQYRESAFNFVSRLMEEEGIFYYFKHSESKHTLVLADNKGAYFDIKENQLEFHTGSYEQNHIDSWDRVTNFRSGKYTHTDYNFETPSADMLANTNTLKNLPQLSKFEIFDYPGVHADKGEGTDYAKLHIEEEEANYEATSGTSHNVTMAVGGKFNLTHHDMHGEEGDYVITSVQHSAQDSTYTTTGQISSYQNSFQVLPAAVVARPGRLTPQAVVQGPQTAVVTGPKGEEIYVDKYGRVKVQFFWDREGKKDENTTCWIRVSETWAGKNWGMVYHPRIGQEVIVDFLEGNPDRPIITGRVYNAEQMPPYDLPANMTQSGVKSRSSKGGGGADFNELRFEDKKGKEEIYFHAQRDFKRIVERNDDLEVGNDQTEKIENKRETTINKSDDKLTLNQGNQKVQIKMGNQNTKVDLGKIETEAMQSIELKVGQSSIKIDQMSITLKSMMINIESQLKTSVKSNLMVEIQAGAMLKVGAPMMMFG